MLTRLKRRLPFGLKRRIRPYYDRWRYRQMAAINQRKTIMPETIRWGIIATGNISKQFAAGLSVLPDAKLVAVGSRTQESADRFGDLFGVPNRHGTYEALAADPEIDAVYIGSVHTEHKANTLLCLANGKHVLCEKPFAINAADSLEMIGVAEARGLFLMEAMWMRFIPSTVKLFELIEAGAIGEIRQVQADFGINVPFDPKNRLFDPEVGGGVLLDIGIYPLTFATMLLGEPSSIKSQVTFAPTDVDEQIALSLRYPNDALASLSAASRTATRCGAIVYGSEGYIEVKPQFWHSEHLTLYKPNQAPQEIPVPMEGNGYNYEAAEVMAGIRAGRTQSEIWPLEKTLSIMRLMDGLRAEWGLKYANE